VVLRRVEGGQEGRAVHHVRDERPRHLQLPVPTPSSRAGRRGAGHVEGGQRRLIIPPSLGYGRTLQRHPAELDARVRYRTDQRAVGRFSGDAGYRRQRLQPDAPDGIEDAIVNLPFAIVPVVARDAGPAHLAVERQRLRHRHFDASASDPTPALGQQTESTATALEGRFDAVDDGGSGP